MNRFEAESSCSIMPFKVLLLVISIAIGTPLARQFGAANVFFVSGGLEVLLGIVAALVAGKVRQQFGKS